MSQPISGPMVVPNTRQSVLAKYYKHSITPLLLLLKHPLSVFVTSCPSLYPVGGNVLSFF